MTREEGVLTAKKIGLFGKGGAGKSTVTIMLAGVLKDLGYEVSILDADSTNVGLSQALGLDRSPRSLIDYFGGMVFRGGRVTCPVDDPTPLADAEISLDTLPSEYFGRTIEGAYVLVAGKMGEQGPGAGCDGPMSKIARDLTLRLSKMSPVTLIDFKAGFEDTARGVVTGLDWALCVVDPTCASVQMAVDLARTVEELKAGAPPATKHLETPELVEIANRSYAHARIKGVLAALNKIDSEEAERILREKLAEGDVEPIGTIHEDPSIHLSWLRGTPLRWAGRWDEARGIAKKLEAAERESMNSRVEVV